MHYLFIGTYTENSSKGIYVCRFENAAGAAIPCTCCKVVNPSYLVLNARNGHIYSVSEDDGGKAYANTLRFDPRGEELELVNRRITGGAGACHIAVAPGGEFAVTANYGGGSISVFPIDRQGRLMPRSQDIQFTGKGADPQRQDAPHPHCTVFTPEGKYMLVTDLGTDTLYRFEVGGEREGFVVETSKKEFRTRPGTGPRHLVFHPDAKHLYVVNELAGSVSACEYRDGEVIPVQELLLGEKPQQGGGSAAISAAGTRLYVSLREGNDGIAAFDIDHDGRLVRREFRSSLPHPRHIGLSRDGEYLFSAAMKGNAVEIWKVSQDGSLTATENSIPVDSPTFVGMQSF